MVGARQQTVQSWGESLSYRAHFVETAQLTIDECCQRSSKRHKSTNDSRNLSPRRLSLLFGLTLAPSRHLPQKSGCRRKKNQQTQKCLPPTLDPDCTPGQVIQGSEAEGKGSSRCRC